MEKDKHLLSAGTSKYVKMEVFNPFNPINIISVNSEVVENQLFVDHIGSASVQKSRFSSHRNQLIHFNRINDLKVTLS